MSQLDSGTAGPSRGVLVQKPKSNVFTALLIIAFLALLVACVVLYLELARYGGLSAVTGG